MCNYTPPRRTKRKRTDVRVRELEQEVKTLGELVRSGKAGELSEPPHPDLPDGEPVHPRPTHSMSLGNPATTDPSPQVPDPIDSGLLSIQHAAQLFDRYVSDLAPQRPLVVFPFGIGANHLRTSKPTLFLAILAVSAGTLDENLSTKLMDMLLKIYAERIMIRGEKSLELIQAILVSTNWSCPPDQYDQLKFYQQLHMAATMAMEMGLGEVNSTPNVQSVGATTDGTGIDSNFLDPLRTFLGCYICCSR